jgi:PhnB protein
MPTDYKPAGYHSITPFVVVTDGAKAIEFYERVFDAEVISRNDMPDGTIAHAEIRIGDSILQLSDPNPEFGLVSPGTDDAVSASLALYVEDVDATFARAVAAGATARQEPQTFVTGDRFGSILDPYGRRWAVMTRVEDVSREEAERRVDEWLASQGG